MEGAGDVEERGGSVLRRGGEVGQGGDSVTSTCRKLGCLCTTDRKGLV